MWPGQQPPGGEQNPRDQNPNPNQNPNPYQQPGYGQPEYEQPGYGQPGYGQPGQQPNPYQQQPGYPQQQPGYPPQDPGYQQQPPGYPGQNPYKQPPVPQYGAPGRPPGDPTPPGGRKKTTIIAVVAAFVVVVAAGVTGFLVLGGKDDDAKAADDTPPPATAKPDPTVTPANPRGGDGSSAPQIAGWKVVTNPKRGTQFDVPPDWSVEGSGQSIGLEDEKKKDGTPLVTFSSPALFKKSWCTLPSDGSTDFTSLGATGTKGGQGAKDTASAAVNEASGWVWAAYAQSVPDKNLKQKLKVSKAAPFTTTSGLKGSYATATATGIPKKDKCDSDGKAVAFTFTNATGDYTTWVFYGAKSVPGEIPDATLKKILGSVRLLKAG
jgi:hypothetical protein